MSSSTQSNKNTITLKGSAAIISEYLNYGINSILFQRGIYPPESFINTQQYGITILMSKDSKIIEFLQNVLSQVEEWLSLNILQKVSMVITNVHTNESLECWDFNVESEPTATGPGGDDGNKTSNKDMKRIQQEIRDVMRQISATVSYLPLIDSVCSFDVMIYTIKDCEIPEKWNETEPIYIKNSQAVKLRSFDTGLHKVDTVVNYKMT